MCFGRLSSNNGMTTFYLLCIDEHLEPVMMSLFFSINQVSNKKQRPLLGKPLLLESNPWEVAAQNSGATKETVITTTGHHQHQVLRPTSSEAQNLTKAKRKVALVRCRVVVMFQSPETQLQRLVQVKVSHVLVK